MPLVEPLAPEGHRRIPWKNGRGELVVIDREGGENWHDMGVNWNFGRTTIIEEGPFSNYAGYERLPVGEVGTEMSCKPGRHVVYAPVGAAQVEIDGRIYILMEDHALRLRTQSATNVTVRDGQVIIGSIHIKA
jgi:hypothetical protein